MAINKVVYGSTPLIDLTDSTLSDPSDLMSGVTAYDRTGTLLTGTGTGGGQGGNVWQDQDGYVHLDDEAQSGQITVESLNVTQNGTYTAPTGKAYSPVTVSVSGGGGQYAWLGSGAEKASTIASVVFNLKDDTTYDSWEATTSSTIIRAESATAEHTVTLDLASYDYCILWTAFCEPKYLPNTALINTTYRYSFVSGNIVSGRALGSQDPSSTFPITTASQVSLSSASSVYYYNATGIIARSNTIYAPCYVVAIPSLVFGTVSNESVSVEVKYPAIYARCNSSRFATSMKSFVDSENTNLSITLDLIRCPHGNSCLGNTSKMMYDALNAQ